MRWLVTGGLGFVGSQLVRDLVAKKEEVLVLDNGLRRAPGSDFIISHPLCSLHMCDLVDQESFNARALGFDADYYVHLAAMHYIPDCRDDPQGTIKSNILATQNILQTFESSDAARFTFVSSGAVYSDSSEELSEVSAISPVDVYGVSKYSGELLCNISERKEDISVVRLFNVFGPRETNAHIIPEIMSQLRFSNELLLGNIEPVRDFIHVKDASSGLEKATTEIGNYEELNLSGNQVASIRDIIKIIAELLGMEVEVKKDKNKFRVVDKEVQKADISRILTSTSWRPNVGLREGLKELLQIEGLINR